MAKTVFLQSIGPELHRYDVDAAACALQKRDTVIIPGANVQYVWQHPSRKYLYVVSSDGGLGTIPSTRNIASAFRIDPATGALSPHGPEAKLPSRPVHCSVDRSGRYLLIAYNHPSNITVHCINADGSIGDLVAQPDALDFGIFAHQVLTTPDDRTAILVTRGNNPEGAKPEDPGALKVFGFRDGQLSNLASVAPGDGTGLGFGPRHFDIHRNGKWLFLSVERQSELHVYRINDDGTLAREPLFVASSLADRANAGHSQMSGAIHIHPNGRVVSMTNRNSSTEAIGGKRVWKGGENNVATFSIDPASGQPKLIQNIDTQTIHPRTFTIDPTGKMLIAASVLPMPMRDGSTCPAALVIYRIGDDGRLSFVRKQDVDTGRFMQFWTGIVTLI